MKEISKKPKQTPIALMLIVTAIGSLASVGCATVGKSGAFKYSFADNNSADIQEVLADKRGAAPKHAATNIVVAYTETDDSGQGGELVAAEIGKGQLWSKSVPALTRPEIVGDAVIVASRETVSAYDLRSGEERWSKKTEKLAYVGATQAGKNVVFVESVGAGGGATRRGIVRALSLTSGSNAWSYEIQGTLGRPATLGQYVFVPWDRQNIAVIKADSGTEIARVRTTDDIISWVRAQDGVLTYGHKAAYRFDEKTFHATKKESTRIAPPIAELPGEPLPAGDGFYPIPATKTALGRIRVYFAPNQGKEFAAAHGRYYYVYYRYVFGLDAEGKVEFARKLDADIVYGRASNEGLDVVQADGSVRRLAPDDGSDLMSAKLDINVASADFGQLSNLGLLAENETQTAAEGMLAIAEDVDFRLVAARAYAADQLSKLEEPSISASLLALYAKRGTPRTLKASLRQSLMQRDTGIEYVIKALEQRYDFLAGTESPPLELIVPALVRAQSKEAVPQLIAHLFDHETKATHLPILIEAIAELGDKKALTQIEAFITRYRADRSVQKDKDVLATAATVLFEARKPEERTFIAQLKSDPWASKALKAEITKQEGLEAAAIALAAKNKAEQEAADALAKSEAEYAGRPDRLARTEIQGVFKKNQKPLGECIEAEKARNPKLGQVRIAFILSGSDGKANNIRLVPNRPEFVECITPKIAALDFPKFKDTRQRGALTIQLGVEKGDAVETNDTKATWWARNEARAIAPDDAVGRAWWQKRAATKKDRDTAIAKGGDKKEAKDEKAKAAWWAGADAGDETSGDEANEAEEKEASKKPAKSKTKAKADKPKKAKPTKAKKTEAKEDKEEGPAWWEAAE